MLSIARVLKELMSPLTVTDLHSESLEWEVDYTFCFNLSIIFLSATVSHIDSVLKVYLQFVSCIFPCAALSVVLISSLLPAVDWCFSLSFICCWLSRSFSLFFLPPLFSGLDCFQEPYGVMSALSACLSIHVLVFMFVSSIYHSQCHLQSLLKRQPSSALS